MCITLTSCWPVRPCRIATKFVSADRLGGRKSVRHHPRAPSRVSGALRRGPGPEDNAVRPAPAAHSTGGRPRPPRHRAAAWPSPGCANRRPARLTRFAQRADLPRPACSLRRACHQPTFAARVRSVSVTSSAGVAEMRRACALRIGAVLVLAGHPAPSAPGGRVRVLDQRALQAGERRCGEALCAPFGSTEGVVPAGIEAARTLGAVADAPRGSAAIGFEARPPRSRPSRTIGRSSAFDRHEEGPGRPNCSPCPAEVDDADPAAGY